MSGRSVADVVADLRLPTWTPGFDADAARLAAADLLERLDAERAGQWRYLCERGHHVVGIDSTLTICPARAWKDGAAHGPICGAVLNRYSDDPSWRLYDLDALRPPCPTCDGKKVVTTTHRDDDQGRGESLTTVRSAPCPENGGNCDGRMSWEHMAAIVTAVFRYEDDQLPVTADAYRGYLRSVR